MNIKKTADGFTKKYNISSVVFYETTGNVEAAIAREKQLKGWRRNKKIALIELPTRGGTTFLWAGMGEVQRKRPLASLGVT